MEQNRPAPRRALSPKERRRRHRIRLVRNWTVFLLSCGAVMAVMTGGILWLLPRAYALIAPPTAFEAREYEGGAETDLSDKRLVLVNANLPLTEEPTPELYAEVRNWVRKEIGPLATPDVLHWTDSLPKTRSGKIMRRILRKIAAGDTSNLGDTSTLADPGVVEKLLEEKQAIAMPS